MAARLSRSHSETVRQKIQASNLINRLQKHIDGEIELTSTQLKAIEMLLDLSQVQHIGDDKRPIRINLGWLK